MARPTKYTPNLAQRIRRYITDGLTVRDACFGVGISEDTFCRWRREKPEFAKMVQEATEAQTWSSLALAKTSEYRRYTRKCKAYKMQQKCPRRSNTHLDAQSALKTALNTPQSHFYTPDVQTCLKLKTRTSPPTDDFGELVCCEPYVNTMTNRIEWVEKGMYGRPVLHGFSTERFQQIPFRL